MNTKVGIERREGVGRGRKMVNIITNGRGERRKGRKGKEN